MTTTQLPNSLDAKAERIRALGKQTIENVIEVGRLLVECKAELGHGRFGAWLNREFGWTENSARNFMRVYKMQNSNRNTIYSSLGIPLKSLYLLAALENADIRDDVIEEIRRTKATGACITNKTVENAIRARKPKVLKSSKPDAAQLAEVLNILRPLIAEAEALLMRANEALKTSETPE